MEADENLNQYKFKIKKLFNNRYCEPLITKSLKELRILKTKISKTAQIIIEQHEYNYLKSTKLENENSNIKIKKSIKNVSPIEANSYDNTKIKNILKKLNNSLNHVETLINN